MITSVNLYPFKYDRRIYWDHQIRTLLGYMLLFPAFTVASFVAFPFTIPYGLYHTGKHYNQGGSYWSTFWGGIIFAEAFYGIAFDRKDFDPIAASYLGCVLGSVLAYNVFKPKAGAEIKNKVKTESIFPIIYTDYVGLSFNRE